MTSDHSHAFEKGDIVPRTSRVISRIVTLAAMILSISFPPVARATGQRRAFVFPPAAGPLGAAYGELAAQWWQWVLTAPTPPADGGASANPLMDMTGDACAVGQRGPIWFLAGTSADLGLPPKVTRNCTVPAGKILFFPVVNNAYFAFLTDPDRTIPFIRSMVTSVEKATGLFAEIDRVPVQNIARYLEMSSIFTVVLPAGNIFGLENNFVLSPSADEGYYLAVALPSPPPGEEAATHEIHFGAANDGRGNELDVTYKITVKAL